MVLINSKQMPRHRRPSRGFTLLEALVTMAIVAIMLGLAAPSFVSFQRSSELTATANAFIGALSTARSEALRRQLTVFVVPTTTGKWGDGLTIFADVNKSGGEKIDSTDALIVKTDAIPGSVSASVYTGGYVAFNGAGFMTTTANSIALAGSIDFTSIDSSIVARRVITSPAGRMRVCKTTDTGCDKDSL